MKIIVGLGNPGTEYEKTYHNMGFMTLDKFCFLFDRKIKKTECQALTCIFSVKGEDVLLVKPQTFMNLSGISVKSILTKYHASTDDLIVLYDDIDIDRFCVRARTSGTAGTHNGMKSIVKEIGTTNFKRIRLGVGRGEPRQDLANYVLSDIKEPDKDDFDKMFEAVANAVYDFIQGVDFETLMRKLN